MPPKQRKTRNSRRTTTTPPVEETTEQIVERRIAEAIAQYEASRNRDTESRRDTPNENPGNTQQGCSYKNFLACKPSHFNGTEGAIGIIHWIEKMESVLDISNCSRDCMVKYATCTLADKALTWWNAQVQTLGRTNAYSLSWEELKAMILDEFCPRSELQKIEIELWNIMMIGTDIKGYTTRFQELARLVPHMVTPEYKRIERYIYGLVPQIRSLVTSSCPATFKSAVELAQRLTDEAVRMGTLNDTKNLTAGVGKRKWDGDDDQSQDKQLVKRPETAQAYNARTEDKSNYGGQLPYCPNCNHHHVGLCSAPCAKCKIRGHLAQDCKFPTTATNPNAPRACFVCGRTGHFMKDCPEQQD